MRLTRATWAVALAFGLFVALRQWVIVPPAGGPGADTREYGWQPATPLPFGVTPFELQVVGARRVYGATMTTGAAVVAAGLVAWDAKRWEGECLTRDNRDG